MKTNILKIIMGFVIVLIIISIFFVIKINQLTNTYDTGEISVLLSEIEELDKDENGENPAQEQIDEIRAFFQDNEEEIIRSELYAMGTTIVVFSIIYMLAIYIYIYFKILRPFQILENYAGNIAEGNLDIPLKYQRNNMFGAFTWAFDHMREEMKASKVSERKAIEDNKTIIASISHDIKTPIASIRAYSEGLEANLDSSYEKREYYLSIIMKKCDEVTALTNDLVLHSLSELNSISINMQKISIDTLLIKAVNDLEFSGISLDNDIDKSYVNVDPKRLEQVIENILNNSRKYAENSKVEIFTDLEDEWYKIHFRDYGKGIPPEDMPFIFNKFYRGKNTENINGSGLGLFIVKDILTRMGGKILLENHEDGLEVKIFLKIS